MPPAVITPGAYLRLRREAAGLSVSHVAKASVSSPVGLAAAAIAIEEAEADRSLLSVSDLLRLKEFVPMVPAIYTALAYGLPCRPFCRRCGCSQTDACADGAGVGCAWTDASRTLCTRCFRKAS